MRFLPLSCVLLAGCWVTTLEITTKLGDVEPAFVSPDNPEPEPEPAVEPPEPEPEPAAEPEPSCWDVDLGGAMGDSVAAGGLAGETDDHLGACTDGSGGADVAFGWTSPADGCWSFDTLFSSFDTVLYLLDACDGVQLECSDDLTNGSGLKTSSLTMRVDENETVVVVLDAFSIDESGTYNLNILPAETIDADLDLGSAYGQAVATGDNRTSDTSVIPDFCPYATAMDEVIRWVAPLAGVWRFTTDGTSFDSALSVHRECDVGGLACDDQDGAGGEAIDVRVPLAGTVLYIRIAGYLSTSDQTTSVGDYVLNIEFRAPL